MMKTERLRRVFELHCATNLLASEDGLQLTDHVFRDRLRALQREIEKLSRDLETDERRENQTKAMASVGTTVPVEPGADIGSFAADLVWHANRLGCRVEGKFNDTVLRAAPNSSERDIFQAYDRSRLR